MKKNDIKMAYIQITDTQIIINTGVREPRVLILDKEGIQRLQGFENYESDSTILLNEEISEHTRLVIKIPSGQHYTEYYIEDNFLKLIFEHQK